jgi:hypothetical protein
LRRWFVALLLAVSSPGDAALPLTTPERHVRGTEQTYLTFPEWFLVFSPAEYADFVNDHRPTQFPFLGHVAQFWDGYARVTLAASDGYPPNPGYHAMILVIGISTTVEYAIRSAYETLVGRLSEAASGETVTPEDRLGAAVAREYVDFIRVYPWYEFDFLEPLNRLWRQPAVGPGMPRKWERRYALTTEYLVKGGYGWLIRKATKASYDEPLPVTAVIVRSLPESFTPPRDASLVERRPDGLALLLLPRYQAFTEHATALARQGAAFEEIAGNRSVILVSALIPAGKPLPAGKILFTQPIITRPGSRRVALVVPVPELSERLLALQSSGAMLEHVFDY